MIKSDNIKTSQLFSICKHLNCFGNNANILNKGKSKLKYEIKNNELNNSLFNLLRIYNLYNSDIYDESNKDLTTLLPILKQNKPISLNNEIQSNSNYLSILQKYKDIELQHIYKDIQKSQQYRNKVKNLINKINFNRSSSKEFLKYYNYKVKYLIRDLVISQKIIIFNQINLLQTEFIKLLDYDIKNELKAKYMK